MFFLLSFFQKFNRSVRRCGNAPHFASYAFFLSAPQCEHCGVIFSFWGNFYPKFRRCGSFPAVSSSANRSPMLLFFQLKTCTPFLLLLAAGRAFRLLHCLMQVACQSLDGSSNAPSVFRSPFPRAASTRRAWRGSPRLIGGVVPQSPPAFGGIFSLSKF